MIIGNYFEMGRYVPEYVNLANGHNKSKLSWSGISFNDIWSSHIYGIVATLINEQMIICGGGEFTSTCNSDVVVSTTRCQSFNLKEYTLATLNLSMTEERTFAQSMVFENTTWFIMGGRDSHGIATDTTEYLDINGTNFVSHSKMPEYFSHHCAKKINNSHLFTTGGLKNPSLLQPSASLFRG